MAGDLAAPARDRLGPQHRPHRAGLGLTAQLRGDPDLGTYGFVAYRGQLDHDEPRCRVAGSFDDATYRMRFPAGCIGSPERLRFTAYVQLYNDTADGIIGGDYAPAWDEFSTWLDLR